MATSSRPGPYTLHGVLLQEWLVGGVGELETARRSMVEGESEQPASNSQLVGRSAHLTPA